LKEPDGRETVRLIRELLMSDQTTAIGLGNPDRADDGAGIQIVLKWKARLKKRAFCENEISAEEAVMKGLEEPSVGTFLFVDAADFKGRPGEMRLFDSGEAGLIQSAFSTHKVPLDLLFGMITARGKKAFLLGIQPGSVEWLGEKSKPVRETIRRLELLTGR
jgi:hydrogenase maturation protease